jgi:DNA N-6-adenine-methyltransferase (Dam)
MTAGRKSVTVNKDWATPKKYVDAIRDFFEGRVDLDPCSSKSSIVDAKVEYSLPDSDGLSESWNYHTIYVNPPYGADRERRTTIKDWIAKCDEAHEGFGSEVLALVPVATNTRHWKDHIFGKASAICFLGDTRLRFIINGTEDNKGAPMSCAMVYWGGNVSRFYEVFAKFGAVVDVTPLIHSHWKYPMVPNRV